MLYLDIKGRPLLLPSGSTAQVEHVNPLFADGFEDSYSLPVELPSEGNEEVLGHVHDLALNERQLTLVGAHMGHQGMPLFPGSLHILSTVPRSVRCTFSIEGFVSTLRGIMLNELLRGEVIDMLLDDVVSGNDYRLRPRYALGGQCQFPMHLNPSLYGDANPDWYPTAGEWSSTATYITNDLVTYTVAGNVIRSYVYQATEAVGAGESPDTHPSKWRRASFGLVNAWDVDGNTIYLNTVANFYAQVPWFYVKWVLRVALERMGYQAVGTFMDDPRTDEWLLPNTTTIDAQRSISELYFFRATQNTQTPFVPGQLYIVRAQDETTAPNQDADTVWDNTTHEWECPDDGTFVLQFTAAMNRYGEPPNSAQWTAYTEAVLYDETTTIIQTLTLPAVLPWDLQRTATFTLVQTTGDIGKKYRCTFRQMARAPIIGQSGFQYAQLWPLTPSDAYTAAIATGWLASVAPTVSMPDQFIHPHRHVPRVSLIAFILAIADAWNLAIDPDEASRTVRLDYKENTLLDSAPRTDHSHRLVNEVEIDHQRRTPGFRLHWDIETNKDDAGNLLDLPEYYSEEDVPPPYITGQRCVLKSTRKLLKSVFRSGTFVWEPVGYHVPDVVVGDSEQATTITPGCKPLHMEQITLDGRSFIVPVLDAAGTSAWFHNEGEREIIWLCEFAYATDPEPGTILVSGARSWGYNWGAPGDVESDELSRGTLLWNAEDAYVTGMYQRHYLRWLNMLTTSEPVTLDLLVDMPYLTGKEWRGIHHMHGQDYLIERLPMEYGASRGQLISTGGYAMRLRHSLLDTSIPEVIVPFVCAGEGYGSFTATMATSFTVDSDTGYVTIRNAETGALTTFGVGTPGNVEVVVDDPTTYCMFASSEEGEKNGNLVSIQYGTYDLENVVLQYFTSLYAVDVVFDTLSSLDFSTLPELTQLSGQGNITSIDLSPLPVLNTVSFYSCYSLTTVIPPPTPTLEIATFQGCALDQASVDAIILACNDTMPAGQLLLNYGTNASPSSDPAVTAKLAALTFAAWDIQLP